MKPITPSEPASPAGDEATGVPFLRTWRGVYLVVSGSFILWVVLLAALMRMFS